MAGEEWTWRSGGNRVSNWAAGRGSDVDVVGRRGRVHEDLAPTRKAKEMSKAGNFGKIHGNDVPYNPPTSQIEVWPSLTDHQGSFGTLGMMITRGQASATPNPPRVKHTVILTYQERAIPRSSQLFRPFHPYPSIFGVPSAQPFPHPLEAPSFTLPPHFPSSRPKPSYRNSRYESPIQRI